MKWWSRLFGRNRMENQLEKELRFHLEQHQSDLIAHGHSAAEAEREARIALGGPEQVKERCRDARGTRWAEELIQDTRYAVRSFRHKPGFTAITLLISALGIGATTVMFTLVNSVLLNPLPFSEPGRLVVLHGFLEHLGEFWGYSYPDFQDIRHESHALALAAWTFGGATMSAPGEPQYVDGRQVSADLFRTLGILPLYGRTFRSDEDRPGAAPVAMISFHLWQQRFAGDRLAALGAKLAYDGKTYVVIGITRPGFELSGAADVFTPLGQSTDPRMRNRNAAFLKVVGRLASPVTLNQAQAEITVINRRLAREYPKSDAGVRMLVRPFQNDLVKDVSGTLWLLLSAVGLVLFIACVNIASLFLTRAASREREWAMRVALGARRSRLIRQCITESAVLGLSGGVLGIFVAAASLHPFLALWPGNLPRANEIHMDWRVLCFAVGTSLVCGLCFGLTPALRVPMHGLEQSLRGGGGRSTANARRLHSPFVVSEIALALVLLVAAGMLGNTLLTLSSLNPGLNAKNVLTARFALSPSVLTDPAKIRAAWQDVLDRTRRLPDVQFAALADIVPMRDGENVLNYRATPNRPPADQQPFALASSVTPDYLDVMGIPLREGRFFDQHDGEQGEAVVVVDENLAQHAFGRKKNVVGERLWIEAMGSAPLRIVGVVGHVRHWGLAGDDQSHVHDEMYYPFAQVPASLLHFFSSVMSITVRTRSSPLNIVEPLQRELRGAAGDQALYDIRTVEQLVGASLDRQRFLSLLFGIFSGLALLLACVGVYGVLAYLTGQRTPEIGLRMAVGASVRDVQWLVLRQSLKMIGIGVGLGMIGAVSAARLLQYLVEGTRPINAATYAMMSSLLIVAALLASFLPARRASLIDPVKALRPE
jgi:predicted permease